MQSIHDVDALRALGKRARVEPPVLRRFAAAFLKKHRPPDEALEVLPPATRDRFRDALDFHPLVVERRIDSKRDGATKLLCRTRAGHRIETVVLRIASGRTSLCLSSQAGCAAACTFCASGRMGLAGNLAAAEILDQVVHAGRLLDAEGRRIRNVVFMGMGEPFHNEANLHEAIRRLTAGDGFHIDEPRVLVSTVGVPDAMLRYARAFPRARLALSLHAARPEQRRKIIPLARRVSLDDLRAALVDVARLQDREVMIEVLMLDGVNDADADLEALGNWLEGLPVHVNLIPYNAVPGVELRGSPPARQAEFSTALKRRGFRVTTRYSLGADIAAACGQLARTT